MQRGAYEGLRLPAGMARPASRHAPRSADGKCKRRVRRRGGWSPHESVTRFAIVRCVDHDVPIERVALAQASPSWPSDANAPPARSSRLHALVELVRTGLRIPIWQVEPGPRSAPDLTTVRARRCSNHPRRGHLQDPSRPGSIRLPCFARQSVYASVPTGHRRPP
jgi:hypothetical protein